MANKKSDIFSLIKADHRKVESLFSKIEKTSERSSEKRDKLYSELRFELTLHAHAEETALYPVLKEETATEDIGYESVEEHSLMKFLFGKLDETPCDSKEWTAQIVALKEVVNHHVKEEEKEMFPKMKKTFSKVQLEAIAEEFRMVKKQAKNSDLKTMPAAA